MICTEEYLEYLQNVSDDRFRFQGEFKGIEDLLIKKSYVIESKILRNSDY